MMKIAFPDPLQPTSMETMRPESRRCLRRIFFLARHSRNPGRKERIHPMNPLIQFKPTIPQRNRERQDSFAQLEVITMKIMQSLVLWKSFHRNNIESHLRCLARAFFPSATAILTLLLSTMSSSFAGSATWKASPATGDWFTATNWTPTTVPNGPADTATFASSNKTRPFIAFNAELNGIVFNPGASAFTIMNALGTSPTLSISGAGITNNSGIVQNFAFELAGAQILFLNSATAGSLTAFTTTNMTFGGTSTAGSATFTNNGLMNFSNTATAGDATITNNVELTFDGSSIAGNATFTNPGGFINFRDTSTGGNATFTNQDGGIIVFNDFFGTGNAGTGGNATF